MIKLFLIIKDKNYEQFFEGTLDQFETFIFKLPDATSLESKLNTIKKWATDNNYSLEIKDGSKIYA